jgi:hypothetical protein
MDVNDPVNHPTHYTQGALEVIDAIEGMELPYHEGNIVKYVARWRYKNGVQDLRKAKWYLERLIANAEKQAASGT